MHKKISSLAKKNLVTFGIISFVSLSVFVITKQAPAHKAELSFTETSKIANIVGSVIPASCESSPAVSHSSGDCITICSNSPNLLYSSNTVYDYASNSCVCANGAPKATVPTCPPPKVKLAFSQGATTHTFMRINSVAISNSYVTHWCDFEGIATESYLSWNVDGASSCRIIRNSADRGGATIPTGTYTVTPETNNAITVKLQLICTDSNGDTVTTDKSVYFSAKPSNATCDNLKNL